MPGTSVMAVTVKMAALRVLVLCLLVPPAFSTPVTRQTRIVSTTSGDVQGRSETLPDGSLYDSFLGIPFAAPPVGDGRFRKPDAPSGWNETLQAVEHGPACTQIIQASDEDCLYLNVVVPEGIDAHESPLPVMVYSYGGAFLLGAGDDYPAHGLAVRAKVIVVTYNYRVSSMGFLSTGDEWAPGNYGLWDARAAFIWVRDNIRAFGGDPGRVTAFGQSAGGVISSHFMTSPLTSGLVHRVLALSGASSAFFGHSVDNTKMTRNLAVGSLCPIWSSEAMLRCLRNKGAAYLDFNGYVTAITLGRQMPAWIPVVDGDFVPRRPQEALEAGVGGHVDLMIGSTHDDGAGFMYVNPLGLPGYNINLASDPVVLENVMKLLFSPYGNTTYLVHVVQEQYPDLLSEDVLTRTKAASQSLTDFAFGSAAYLEADLHSKSTGETGRGTYLYEFRYRQSFQHYAPWVNGSHVDDVWSVFGEEFNTELRERVLGEFSDTDRLVSRHLASYYGNFAYTGDPNEGPHVVPTRWPQYDSATQRYMEENPQMEVKVMTEDMRTRHHFWTVTWPAIVGGMKEFAAPQDDGIQAAVDIITEHVKGYISRVIRATLPRTYY